MMMRAPTFPAAAVVALALATPAAAQGLLDPDEAPASAGDEDLLMPQNRQAPALFGGETEGYAAEEFYWMNPETDRWPNDLDPRDHEYLPSPRPNVTFKLDLDL